MRRRLLYKTIDKQTGLWGLINPVGQFECLLDDVLCDIQPDSEGRFEVDCQHFRLKDGPTDIVLGTKKDMLLENISYAFDGCKALETIDITALDTSGLIYMNNLFSDCYNLGEINVTGLITSDVRDMSAVFHFCKSLQALDVTHFVTDNATTMASMFAGCQQLQSLDLSGFNTSNVTNTSSMFSDCWALAELDLSQFDMSNVTNAENMFIWAGVTKIKCTQSFKEWCIENRDIIKLNTDNVEWLIV